jgi:hypothetical protein
MRWKEAQLDAGLPTALIVIEERIPANDELLIERRGPNNYNIVGVGAVLWIPTQHTDDGISFP